MSGMVMKLGSADQWHRFSSWVLEFPSKLPSIFTSKCVILTVVVRNLLAAPSSPALFTLPPPLLFSFFQPVLRVEFYRSAQ